MQWTGYVWGNFTIGSVVRTLGIVAFRGNKRQRAVRPNLSWFVAFLFSGKGKVSIMITCPSCNLVNPDNTYKCDCGFVLEEKILCEEEDTRTPVYVKKKSRSKFPYIYIFLGIICLAFLLILIAITKFNTGDNRSGLRDGMEAHINTDAEAVIVATEKKYLDDFFNAKRLNDTYGIKELFVAGKIFDVKNCTKILILNKGFLTIKIRVLEGEKEGMSGWVDTERIKCWKPENDSEGFQRVLIDEMLPRGKLPI